MSRSPVSDQSTRRAVATFALSGLAILVLLGAAGVELLRRAGDAEAIRNAKRVTRLAGEGIVEPELTGPLLRGDPRAIARVDRAVRGRVLRDPVVRVKIWDASGRIIYSDEKRLIGSRYSLDPDDATTLRRGGVDAEVSDLTKPENRFERSYDKLLEVYLPVRTPGGHRLLFESYLRSSSVAASGRSIWLRFAPAILGALVALWLIQLPLALRLARRIRQGQVEREALLRRALDASDVERRRIARDLHDGVVQSLVGVSYTLAAAAEGAPPRVADTLDEAAGRTRQGIRELRSLLVEIYPPDLQRVGLSAALSDLVAPLRSRDIDARAVVPDDLRLPPDTEALFFRVTQEALRNVVRHAHARSVEVLVRQEDSHASLAVTDDGRGFVSNGGPAGHFGLQMMEDAARDAGGTLEVDSAPGRGTRVHVEVPL